jgi:hypothetical protein
MQSIETKFCEKAVSLAEAKSVAIKAATSWAQGTSFDIGVISLECVASNLGG